MEVALLIVCGAIMFVPIGCALSLFLKIIDEIDKEESDPWRFDYGRRK